MPRVDRASWQHRRPAGVVHGLQIIEHVVEPNLRARNLFPKDDWRSALRDERKPEWPQMALVTYTLAVAGEREWLAWA